MAAPLPQRFLSLAGELKALARGHWQLLQQEMSGKATRTRQQTALMAAGALTALTAVLLALTGLTLLLSQALVAKAGWEPILAAAVSSLTIASVFALAGWLVFSRSGARLQQEGFMPVETLHTLKSTVQALTNQPINPTPTPTPMKTLEEAQDALHQTAESVESQARRTGREAGQTFQSIREKLRPGALLAMVLAGAEALLNPRNRDTAGRALSTVAAFPRRHPALTSLVGLGAVYWYWHRSNGSRGLEDYVAEKANAGKDFAGEARRTAARSCQSAAAAGRDLRSSLHETAARVADNGRTAASQFGHAAAATAEAVRETYDHTRDSVIEGVEKLTETAHQLREDAAASYRRARRFAKEEPALLIAGGIALAFGAMLLVKSSRR